MKKIILTLLFVINVFPCFVGDFWQCGTLVFSQEQMGQEEMCGITCPDNSVEEYPCEWHVSICAAKAIACRDCGAKLEEGQVCSCKNSCPCDVSNCTGGHCSSISDL